MPPVKVNILPNDLIADLVRHGIDPASSLDDLKRVAVERGLVPPAIHSPDSTDHRVTFPGGGDANADSLLVAFAVALVLTLDAKAMQQ